MKQGSEDQAHRISEAHAAIRFRSFLIYFLILFGFGFISFDRFRQHQLNSTRDHGLITYTILDNIQRIEHFDFKDWTNRRIFYPNPNTLAYTDHFYFHSFVGLPYHLISHNLFKTYDFIFIIQLLIAITGFYFLAQKLSQSTTAITLSGLYFVYLPAFIEKHPQINFYGLLPWFLFFLIQFVQTRKSRYIYLTALAFLLQALVGVYLQFFLLLFTPILLLLIIIHLIKQARLRDFFHRKMALDTALCLILLGAILFLVNKPYFEFKEEVGVLRKIQAIDNFSADVVLSYFAPNAAGEIYHHLFPALSALVAPPDFNKEAALFLGSTGILVLIASLFCAIAVLISPRRLSFFRNKEVLLVCVIFLFLMWVFSLGPHLHVMHANTGRPFLYYYLYQLHPIFGSIRAPARIVVFMALPLSLLMLWWYEQFKRLEIRPIAKKIGLAIIILLLFADIAKMHRGVNLDPALDLAYVYNYVNETPGNVLLELPSGASCVNLAPEDDTCKIANDGYYEFMHVFHSKWIVNGWSGYIPDNSKRLIRQVDLNFSNRVRLQNVIENNHISLILIHINRISKGYTERYETFIENLQSFGKLIFRNDDYVLISFPSSR